MTPGDDPYILRLQLEAAKRHIERLQLQVFRAEQDREGMVSQVNRWRAEIKMVLEEREA